LNCQMFSTLLATYSIPSSKKLRSLFRPSSMPRPNSSHYFLLFYETSSLRFQHIEIQFRNVFL
jgi:hypothetical protein